MVYSQEVAMGTDDHIIKFQTIKIIRNEHKLENKKQDPKINPIVFMVSIFIYGSKIEQYLVALLGFSGFGIQMMKGQDNDNGVWIRSQFVSFDYSLGSSKIREYFGLF